MIDMLVGISCQAMGCRALEGIRVHLQAEDCRKIIHELEKIDSRAESTNEVIKRERRWSRENFGWRGRLVAFMVRQNLRQAEQRTAAKSQAQQIASQSLLIHLAAHAYELEKGRPPQTIADLTPGYLKSVPIDPVTGTNTVNLP